jgi:hypothetical protein
MPSERNFLRVNVPSVEGALRSVDRTIDHGPTAVKLSNFAATDLPQQPGLTEIHQRITATAK